VSILIESDVLSKVFPRDAAKVGLLVVKVLP
jgi:hypothetical protein